MSKRATVCVMALALVIGGTVVYALPMLGHPTTWTDTRTWGGFIVAVIGVDIALILGERLRAHEQQVRTQAGQPCDMRWNARWKSGRRAIHVFILSPLGILFSLPDWRHSDGDSPTIETFKFLWRIGEVICDIYGGIRGDPLVIYGTVNEKYDYDFEDMVTGFGTFGYALRIDIKRAVRIARDGRTRSLRFP